MSENSNFSNLRLTEFRHSLFEPVIDLADILDYTGRPILLSLPYLRKHELVPFFPKGKWQIKINLNQLIWLRIIDILRQFSYKVSDIQKLCDYFFKDAYNNNLSIANINYNIDRLEKLKLASTISGNELNTLHQLQNTLKDNGLLDFLKLEINYLSNLVMQCLTDREDTGLLVFTDGRVLEYDSKGHGSHNTDAIDINEPHLRISVKYLLQEFIESDELNSLLMPHLLNDNEQRVLKELNKKNIAEINIKRTDVGGLTIKSTTIKTITGEQAKEIRKILGLGNYEEIEVGTRDAKSLYFKKTTKK